MDGTGLAIYILLAVECAALLLLCACIYRLSEAINRYTKRQSYLYDISASLRHIASCAKLPQPTETPEHTRTQEEEDEWQARIERARSWLSELATGRSQKDTLL